MARASGCVKRASMNIVIGQYVTPEIINLSIQDKFTLGRWADWTNESSTKRLMFQVLKTL